MNNSKSLKDRTKKFGRAGYKIHFDRLRNIRAEASFIRTHKFLCGIPKDAEEEIKEKFEKLAKVVDSSEEGSGIWFLVQMAGIGFLFPSAGNKLLSFQEKFGLSFDFGFPVPNQIALSKRLQTGTDNMANIERSFLDIWDVQKSEDLPPISTKILNRIKTDRNNRPFGGRATGLNQWLKDIFAEELKCPEISKVKKGEDYIIFNGAFLKWNEDEILEWVFKKNIPKFSLSDQTFPWLFKNILPAAQLLVEKPGDLMNPYHALGKFVGQFRNDTTQLREILSKQIPNSFSKKDELLILFCNHVQKCANSVPPSEISDFIAEDWAEYRETNFSGRLSGWISNFQNRLGEFQSVLSNSVHEKELDEWKVPNAVRDFLFEKKGNETFIFKRDFSKEFEKKASLVNEETGEIIFEGKIADAHFWKNGLEKRKKSIPKCTKNILRKIREECDFERVFPENFRNNFKHLEKLCDPLLAKLRAVVLEIEDKEPHNDLGKMIEEYFIFWQPVNELLAKWANEGVPKKIRSNDLDEEQEITIWDDTKKVPEPKPENFWIAKSLLADEKEKAANETESESELEIIGKWEKTLIPSALPKYPRFLYEAAKHPKAEIEKAAEILPKILAGAEKFVVSIENQKDENWESETWWTTTKKGEMKWHFGAFHKALEALLKIAVRAKNPKQIIEFLDFFVEWSDEFFENIKELRCNKAGFDERKERQKIEDAQAAWTGLISKQEIETEKLANFHFYLSGREYGFTRYAVVPTKICSMAEFLERFEKHFNLQKNGDLLIFLEVQNGGANDNSATKAELLKFWWARRVQNCADRLNIPDFSGDDIFQENVLKNLVIGKKEISRADAQRFLTAGFGSDIRGKIGTLSRKSFIARNVVQTTNGGQTLLEFVPREWGDFNEFEMLAKNGRQRRRRKIAAKRLAEKKASGDFGFSESAKQILKDSDIDFNNLSNAEITEKIWKKDLNRNPELGKVLGEIPHSWNAILKTKVEIENLTPISSGHFLEKSQDKSLFNFCIKKSDYLYAFPIQTSTVQKQFLERFLWGDRDKILTEKITGPSVILETEKLVKWDDKKPKIQDGETKMFVAIPFQFSKEKSEEILDNRILENTEIEIQNSTGKPQKQYRRERNILGIDLGEYGFGYAVFDPREKKFIESGFIEIALLQKMRDNAASWRDTQGQGIFSRPTTHLADIREKAAGAVRNQIHALALKFDAIPIYEDSVDGFESGGARISKLYKTLKTSDVGNFGSDADKAMVKHIWGGEKRGQKVSPLSSHIGGVIGAAKTSQTCRKCGRCATDEVHNLPDDNLRIENGKIVNKDISCNLPDGEWTKKEVEGAVKKAQRVESEEEKTAREIGKRRRGGVGMFQCQICNHKADADEQAAKNIALKYFFKLTANAEEKEKFTDSKTGQLSTLKLFLHKSKDPQWRNL